ncbi:mycofactocin-coupled SDR family oxidoreductase [Kineosporia succinea]|uniref:SDR family mycofactocin-dependent oxidoreductase n=1 Tax=Kineosporia succinea TaxID=84632 RepID=A0ABT9P713_9ACTN|nr:mycofactocin-coupled SDR family oxidoreductase [Kineosporia succinea]MDP9828492.1 SDR family mycofactocin-dependent oxidoreductase [Kineosporia succinea]
MTGRVEGKVALITGAARGQGRSHAIRLAQEGADIIALDIAESIPSVDRFYPGATEEDLAETVRQVEALDRRIFSAKVDVRDYDALKAATDAGIAEFGRLDIVSANAGIFLHSDKTHEVSDSDWNDVLDINLKGVWHTTKAVTPFLIEQNQGGSIIITSSSAGLKGTPNVAPYTASKHAVLGLARTLSNELAEYSIRVNTIHPTGVATPMILNETTFKLFLPHLEHPTQEQAAEVFRTTNSLPVPWVEAIDISNALLFLASDEARYVTGTELKVDAGYTTK